MEELLSTFLLYFKYIYFLSSFYFQKKMKNDGSTIYLHFK